MSRGINSNHLNRNSRDSLQYLDRSSRKSRKRDGDRDPVTWDAGECLREIERRRRGENAREMRKDRGEGQTEGG